MDLEALHQQLLDPSAYPEPTRTVDFRETHISRVYLTDTCAYKLKKPLDLGFLDFSTLERRAHFCREEVRLNRRFAPDTYLGVAALRVDHGILKIDGAGELVEWAVRMRRLPESRMLDRLIDAAEPALADEIDRLARHLARMLAISPVCREAGGHTAIVRGNCVENLAQTRSAIGRTLSLAAHRAMSALTDARLDELGPLIAAREAQGYVRDGHGDLHARNICMTDPIQVYDCIEFCRRFRVADVAAELAFLLMDLEFRGRRDLAEHFLATYQGEVADPDLPWLLPFYKSYRAWVRGKVENLLADEAEATAELRQRAAERARRYFHLALGYQVPPTLLLTAGLMGTGKTTLAQGLAEVLDAVLLRSDVIRKELAGSRPQQPHRDAFGAGLYASAMSQATYREMRRRARQVLDRGKTAIVDAAFARDADRRDFLTLAAELAVPARILHVQCDEALAMRRLDHRQAEGRDASDGRRELRGAQAAAFEALHAGPHVIAIDSSRSVDYNVDKVLCQLLAC